MARRRHHVVSRGYQRFFADGERVLLIDKNTRTYKEVGTRDTFVEAHFNSWRTQAGWDDSLEDQWQRIEGLVLPDVRVLLAGAGGEQQRGSAKILAAVHFARSYSFRQMQALVGNVVVETEGKRLAAAPLFVSLFTRDVGHAPGPGEAEAYVADRWTDLTKNGRFLQERTVHAYHFAKDYFEPLHVQFLYSHPSLGFVTGDTPLIAADSHLFRTSIRDHMALGDAERIWMPLTTTCSMSLWSSDQEAARDVRLPPSEVQKLNWLVWRAAARFVICRPSQDPSRALLGTHLTRK